MDGSGTAQEPASLPLCRHPCVLLLVLLSALTPEAQFSQDAAVRSHCLVAGGASTRRMRFAPSCLLLR